MNVSFSSAPTPVSKSDLAQQVAAVLQKNDENAKNEVDAFVKETKAETPKISFARLMFSRLTDEQIKAVNESKKLPENAKFVQNGFGGYTIQNNIANITPGTRDLPVGYELKKNFLGFTIVVPVGTESVLIK